jgi:hypothetical protein
MEASEYAGLSAEGRNDPDPNRTDMDVVKKALAEQAAGANASGFARLELMLTAVLPRLVGEGPKTDSD